MKSVIKAAVGLAALALVAGACAPGVAPRWNYGGENPPSQYKRYPRNWAVDYFTRFRRVAFVKVTRPLEDFLSDDQRKWISDHGQPDYRQRTFLSRESEWVDAWAYLAKERLVQFVRGRVVYEGPLTDLERTMITYGYPRGVLFTQAEPDTEFVTFVYSRPFDLEREVFAFANGKMLFRQTQR